MPEEFSRTTEVKRLTPPVAEGEEPDKSDDARHVDVPVIKEILFSDPKTRSQEYNFHFLNSSGSDDDNADATTREVHSQKVLNARLDTDGRTIIRADKDSANSIEVERIDKYRAVDPKSRSQESAYRVYRNDQDPPPTSVGDLVSQDPDTGLNQVVWVDGDGNTFTQLKSHVVRYYMNNDNTLSVWVDSELTDKFEFRDAKEGPGQGRIFTLNNDSLDGSPGTPGKKVSDPSLPNPDTTDPFDPTEAVFAGSPPDNLGNSSKVVDPPWRLDPFQNIVNVSWVVGIFVLFETGHNIPPDPYSDDPSFQGVINWPNNFCTIHTSKDGKTWTSIDVTGWGFSSPIAVNGCWFVHITQVMKYVILNNAPLSANFARENMLLSTDGFNWSVVTSVDDIPPPTPGGNPFDFQNLPLVIGIGYDLLSNTFTYQLTNEAHTDWSVPPDPPIVVNTVDSIVCPFKAKSIPDVPIKHPFPGKITDVVTVTSGTPGFADGLKGFFYSEDGGITYQQSLSVAATSQMFFTCSTPGKNVKATT